MLKRNPISNALIGLPVAAALIAGLAFSEPAIGGQEDQATGIPVVENPLSIVGTKVVPYDIGPGGTAELQVEMALVEHYKAYVERFKISVIRPETYKVGDPKLSPIVQFMDSVSKKVKDGVKGTGTLKAVIEVPVDAVPGEQEIEFAMTYQACTTEHCLFPKTIPVIAKINVKDDNAAPVLATTLPPTAGEEDKSSFEKAMERGLLSALLFVFIGGILTSLTPCVYPMIPITLAVIGARAKGQTRSRSFALSCMYVFGIAITYSMLGVAAASTGALFGSVLSNIYVVTAIALLFVAMGLSMYGLFEIQAPAFIRNRLGTAQTGTGFMGAFTTGLISGVVASPCIGPVLVTTLTWIASTGNRALGFGLLFTFAMGMGILLIVLGTFSHLLNKVPKGGNWMEVVKFTFGTAMVAMALYYIAPLYPDWLFHACLAAALILIASAYGAFEANEGLTSAGRMRKGAMIVTFVIGMVFALSAVSDRAGIKLPGTGHATTDSAGSTTKLNWKNYSDEAVAQAAKDGKPILIDFYADWCAACKELEHLTFPDARVRELADKFTLLKIDATEDSPELQRLKQKYGVIGLPTMIFYDTTGRIRKDLTVTGFEGAGQFSGRMKTALDASQTAANN